MPRKSAHPRVSVDQAIKELLQLHPDDTLVFLLPDVVVTRGRPKDWKFHNVQVRKKDLLRKGLVMDLNIEYRFADGPPFLMVLVEHWSTSQSIDLVRTAQYYLDLVGRFPSHEIVPVAFVTEIEDHGIVDGFKRCALGSEVMSFTTRVVQLSKTQSQDWGHARNVVAITLLMAMGGLMSRQNRLGAVIDFFLQYDEEETRLLFPLLTQVGRFTDEEHAMTIKYLTKLPKPLFMTMMEEQAKSEGKVVGLEEGQRLQALESARKMREHGITWEIVTDVTGVKPGEI